jgi:hypothetical protein
MPQNGAGEAPVAPQAGTASTPGGAPAAPPPKPAEPDFRALHEAAEKKAIALEAKVKESERERLDRLKADKKREAEDEEARRDPSKHLKRLYGDNWYDAVTKAKSGTVAPEHVSAALDAREERIRGMVSEETKALREELAQLRRAEEDRARTDLYRSAGEHAKQNADKYKLTNKYGKADEVGALIEGHFKATAKRNADGTWEPGEMWTPEQGAAEMEKYWTGIRDMVLKAEIGREPPREEPRLTILPSVRQEAAAEPKDEMERRARVDAAWAGLQAKRQQQRPN